MFIIGSTNLSYHLKVFRVRMELLCCKKIASTYNLLLHWNINNFCFSPHYKNPRAQLLTKLCSFNLAMILFCIAQRHPQLLLIINKSIILKNFSARRSFNQSWWLEHLAQSIMKFYMYWWSEIKKNLPGVDLFAIKCINELRSLEEMEWAVWSPSFI